MGQGGISGVDEAEGIGRGNRTNTKSGVGTMRKRNLPEPPIPTDDLRGILKSHRDELSGWLLVPPEWLEFVEYNPLKVVQPNKEAVRCGLDFLRRALDEDGWAVGHRGWIVMKHLEVMGREYQKTLGVREAT